MSKPACKRMLLVGDEHKGGTKALVQNHAAWLSQRGCEVDIVTDRDSSLEERRADHVVVWGGDGSLLATARRMGQNQRPTLGINRGRLGFLTAFEYEQTPRALDMLLAGQLHEEQRLMFWCSLVGPDGVAATPVLVSDMTPVASAIRWRRFASSGPTLVRKRKVAITASGTGIRASAASVGWRINITAADSATVSPDPIRRESWMPRRAGGA